MLVILNIFQSIIDFIEEKCGNLVDYVLGLLESFTTYKISSFSEIIILLQKNFYGCFPYKICYKHI